MNETHAIEMRSVGKTYGAVHALAGIDLTVRPGEIVALLGPNGAGKTTATEILEGYRIADSGHVRVLGCDPARAGRQWRARIGIVPQTSGEQPELSVREFISYFASLYPRRWRVDELIDVVGLAGKARARVRTLSGGQRRRLDVAVGIAGRPQLLFLDEPTTGFDPAARREFWQLITTLRESGTTMLLTTHYLDEAAQLADRVAVMAAGQVRAQGSPDELRARAGARADVRWWDGDRWQVERTMTPTATVRRLLAAHPSAEIDRLEVIRPTLEDVYLELLTGGAEDANKPPAVDAEGRRDGPDSQRPATRTSSGPATTCFAQGTRAEATASQRGEQS